MAEKSKEYLEGGSAFNGGVGIGRCPYPGGGSCWGFWNEGWRDAEEQAPAAKADPAPDAKAEPTPEAEHKAYLEGREACSGGVAQRQNPHPVVGARLLHICWNNGWRHENGGRGNASKAASTAQAEPTPDEGPQCPAHKGVAYQDGWAAFFSDRVTNPYSPSLQDWFQAWYAGWRDAAIQFKAENAPSSAPTPDEKPAGEPDGQAKSERVECWGCDRLTRRIEPVLLCGLCRAHVLDANKDEPKPDEQPAPAKLPRVIWEGHAWVRGVKSKARFVQMDEDGFRAELDGPDAMGDVGWQPATDSTVHRAIAFEYLRKLAGEGEAKEKGGG